MDLLVALLAELSATEYAQWMRYTYLSALGFGLNTDQLVGHFNMHSYSKLDHARTINRWIVDLGGMPSTDVPPIDQYVGTTEGSIEWLIAAELESIEMYNVAHALAGELEMAGLQHDLGQILSCKHENVSSLMDLVAPHTMDDVTIIMLANKFNRFAKTGGKYFQDLVVSKIEGFYRRAGKEFPKTQQAFKLVDYLRSMFDEATGYVLQQLGSNTKAIQEELPEMSRQYIVDDIEKTVRELWPKRNEPEARSALEFYKYVYEWLTSDDTIGRWTGLYENYNPGWWKAYHEDWQQETEAAPQPAMEDIFQQLRPPAEEPEAPAGEPVEAIGDQDYQEWQQSKEDWKQRELQQQQQAPQEVSEEVPQEETRRPVEAPIEQKLKIINPDTKKRDLEVGVGDTVFNQSARQVLQQMAKDHGLTKNQVNDYSVGTIKEIRPDGSLLVTVEGAEDPFNEQIWNQQDRLWGSRESGQRVVN